MHTSPFISEFCSKLKIIFLDYLSVRGKICNLRPLFNQPSCGILYKVIWMTQVEFNIRHNSTDDYPVGKKWQKWLKQLEALFFKILGFKIVLKHTIPHPEGF